MKILSELPDILNNHCHIVNKRAHSTWEKFCRVYLERGKNVVKILALKNCHI